jgi:hypothetical protein
VVESGRLLLEFGVGRVIRSHVVPVKNVNQAAHVVQSEEIQGGRVVVLQKRKE